MDSFSASFEQVKEKIEETHLKSIQNMESCSQIERDLSQVSENVNMLYKDVVPKNEFIGLRIQVNEMKYMLMEIIAALKKESKEDKPEDSKGDEDS